MLNNSHQTLYHDRSNYEGIEAKIAKLPHILGVVGALAGAYGRSGAHTGNWGTKDFNITERIGRAINAPASADGGSNLSGYRPSAGKAAPVVTPNNGFTNERNSVNGDTRVKSPVPDGAPSLDRVGQLRAIGGNRNPSQETEYNDLISSMNQNQQDDQRLIDESYNDSFNYLNQAEGQLRSDLPSHLQEAQGNYDVNSTLLGSQKDSAFGTLGGQEVSATQRRNDAAAANRRLYSDLKMGYGQRFGGASSAGGAASEIANVEQQKQQGKLQQDFGNTIRQIEGQRVEVQKSYDNGIMQLEQQKQQAINQVNRDFQNKLLDINKNRADLNMNKAQARLSALQNMRNQVYQIEVQNMQFKQALEQQKQSAQQQLSSYSSSLGSATGTAGGAVDSFINNTTTNPTSDLTAGNSNRGLTNGRLTGRMGIKDDDYISSLVGPMGGKPKSSFDFLS